MALVIAIVVGAILGAATYFFGGQFLPAPDMVYFTGAQESEAAGMVVTQLCLATGAAAFVGWSLGLYVGARRS